jgi:hypothetical protein
MRNVAVLVLLLHCAAAFATRVGPPNGQGNTTTIPPGGVALFHLHDPELMNTWATFLATTPMLNNTLLPSSLQDRLANVVATYRFLTPVDRPAFFVATYFDLLSERLLAVGADERSEIFPMQVCPVFSSAADASVSKLLAVASGLPDELFVNAPGKPERYRYLFLQTEFSHCKFLATIIPSDDKRPPEQASEHPDTGFGNVSFNVGARPYTAVLSTKRELRALVETVGDVDAITAFRRQVTGPSTADEAEVLIFVRLLALLATDGNSGYAAIPVLFPLLQERADNGYASTTDSLQIADALELAYQAREQFCQIVPFAIRDTEDLLNAKLAVMQSLADFGTADERLTSLLYQFVSGSDLLLATPLATEKMPPIND